MDISEHGLESREVAALKIVQEPRHAPSLYGSQLIINVFQILRPATRGRRVSPGYLGHAMMTHPRGDREEPCLQLLPERLAPALWSRASVPRTMRAKARVGDLGSEGQP